MKRIIVRADRPDSREERKAFVTEGLENGFTSFMLREEDRDLLSLGRFDYSFTLNGVPEDGTRFITIRGPEDQNEAMGCAGKDDRIVLSLADAEVIPLENVIAACRGTGTEVLVMTGDREHAELALSAMEKGADGLVVDVASPSDLRMFRDVCAPSETAELTPVRIAGIRNIEMGDRVCVDTCSVMVPGEGMLIGSCSECLFLVQSESEENGYVASRPFRVNAGAVHGYVRVPGGRTAYLSELEAGSTVLICGRNGCARPATVGRCKNEVRPMVMVQAEHGGRMYSIMLQNAETVRLVTADGSLSVSELRPGDTVLAELSAGGRHFGMPVDETVTEL